MQRRDDRKYEKRYFIVMQQILLTINNKYSAHLKL